MIDQSQTDEVVHRASVPISIEIDEMLSRLPADANLDEIAFDLIAQLAAKSDRPEFIAIFTEALAARQGPDRIGHQALSPNRASPQRSPAIGGI